MPVTVIYTITVTNNGPRDVGASKVEDLLPAGTSFDSAANPGWTLVGGTLSHPAANREAVMP
ncbi:MAG: hypothetical protein ACKOTB_03035 [Planctomycetia bacterium]